MNKKILTLVSYFKNPLFDLNLSLCPIPVKDGLMVYVAEDGPYENGHNTGATFYLNETTREMLSIPIPKVEDKNILVRVRKSGIVPFQIVLPINDNDMSYSPVLYKDTVY